MPFGKDRGLSLHAEVSVRDKREETRNRHKALMASELIERSWAEKQRTPPQLHVCY